MTDSGKASFWSSSPGDWPGVQSAHSGTYFPPNRLDTDIQRSAVNARLNGGGRKRTPRKPGKGGGAKRRKTRSRGRKAGGGKKRKMTRRWVRGKKGGGDSLGQDWINLGRQFEYGATSAYHALAGTHAAANPLPWKGQYAASH